jgi:FkbM family methyltransferase
MSKSLVTSAGMQLNRILQKFGAQLTRFPARADRRRRQLMHTRGISTVVDIGANAGQYALLLRKLGYRGRILSFEPLPDVFEQLSAQSASDALWSVRRCAIADESGHLSMNVAHNSVSSSLLEMADRHVEAAPESHIVGSVSVECVPLSSVLQELLGNPVLVKIDTQGFEKNVLLSGAQLLSSVALFELEMSFVELYRGQALFWEIHALMTGVGFRLVSIEEGFFDETTGELLQCDAIYARADT